MTVLSLTPPVQPELMRLAAFRLRRAVTGFLEPESAPALPLGQFRVDELRLASLRMLATLDAGAEHEQALIAAHEGRALRAIEALAAIDLYELDAGTRHQLACAVAAMHADLRQRADVDVTRGLLDATPAGAALAALVFDTDPGLLDPDAQVSYCQAAQRLESAAHARLGQGMVAFAGSNPRHTQYWVEGDEYVLTDVRSSELASALTWSGSKARDAVESARVMSGELDTACEAAASGVLQPAAVTVIADGVQLLTAGIDEAIADARQALSAGTDSAAEVGDRLWELTQAREAMVQEYDGVVSGFAATHTVAETRRKVRDTLARLDPAGFAARRAKAQVVESGVEFRALPNAMAMVTAVLPSEQATACFSAIDSVARDAQRADQQLPIGIRRCDALYDFCARPLPDDGETSHPTRRSMDAHVDLVMTLDAFLGLDDTPADCLGSGPIPAQAARELLAEAALVTFRRVIVDGDSGHVIETGTKRYKLTESQREFILLRDRTCRHPGCNQPARRCEVDHAVPYDAGGASRADNLGALCARHHLEKTHGGWTIEESSADGSCTFVSPLGRRYRHAPEAALPWLTPDGGPPDDEPS